MAGISGKARENKDKCPLVGRGERLFCPNKIISWGQSNLSPVTLYKSPVHLRNRTC